MVWRSLVDGGGFEGQMHKLAALPTTFGVATYTKPWQRLPSSRRGVSPYRRKLQLSSCSLFVTAVSLRSRAARRGTSPSIDTDKTLKAVEPPVETVQLQTNVLGLRNGGITKKKTQKPMSRQQRLRQQKALERADRNIDKLDRKVATSVQKEKRVKARRVCYPDCMDALHV